MKLDSITIFACNKVIVETDPDNNCVRVIFVDAEHSYRNATVTIYSHDETVPEVERRERATCCDSHRYGGRDWSLPCTKDEEPSTEPVSVPAMVQE